jgi:hypothetical protein
VQNQRKIACQRVRQDGVFVMLDAPIEDGLAKLVIGRMIAVLEECGLGDALRLKNERADQRSFSITVFTPLTAEQIVKADKEARVLAKGRQSP